MRSAGVTLIELVVTIAILGIMAAIATLVLVPAFNAYFDTQRRAEMALTAEALPDLTCLFLARVSAT